MDAIVPDGFSSSYNRKSKKYKSDAIQAQLAKEHKLIDKGEHVSSREMGKDQERVRKCLEKLEHDRIKFCKDYKPSRGSSPFPNTDERDRSHSRGSFRPLSGYDVKSQSRSRRQLQEAGATSLDLKRPTSRRSLDQGKISADSGHDHPQDRQRSHSLSLPSPDKKKSHGLKGATSAVDKRLPDTPIPSIILTEEDCKQSSILFLSPTAKPNADILNNTQAPEKVGANKENRVPPNQDNHPSRSGYREHNPSPRENTRHDSQSRDHHGTKDHHVSSQGAHVKRAHQEDQQHGARAKHGHDHAGSRDHHPHGARPIPRDHHDSQSILPSHRDSRHGEHHADHHSHLHRESRRQSHILENRRYSMVGHNRKLAHENNMEEAQNLYELAIRSVADAHKHSPPTIHGRRGSVSGERRGSLPGERRGSVSLEKPSPLALPEHMPNLSMLDSSAMEDLEELLREVQIFRDRKIAEDEQGFCYMQSRHQRRRLEHIESILEKLSRHSTTKFDPKEMLACGYLRLSKYNVETLENMMRESGQDPGIHAHSDVTNYDLWADIRREKELEKASADVTSSSPTKKIKG